MTKYVKILFDAAKKLWVLPDGSTTASFNWDVFHKFGDHLEFKTINQRIKHEKAMSSMDYFEKFYGRRSKAHKTDKVDNVLNQLVGVPKKTPLIPVEPPRSRVVIKKSPSTNARIG